MAIEDFFANARQEGVRLEDVLNAGPDAETGEQVDTAESQPDIADTDSEETDTPEVDETTTEEVVVEKQIPYHKDPRWIRQREELQAERAARELAERKARELEERFVTTTDFASELVGDDEDAQERIRQWEQHIISKAAQELKQQQEREKQTRAEEQARWLNWVRDNLTELQDETGFKAISDDGETITAEGKELLAVLQEFPIDDGQGNFSIRRGYDLYQKLKVKEQEKSTKNSDARKKLAASTVSKESSASESKDYVTSADLRGGWHSL